MARETKKKNRLSYMILSVIIAIIAWVLVTFITDPDITKTITGVRVELSGEDALLEEGYVITNRDDLPKLSVKMRGKRSDLIKALDRTRVIIDVSQLDTEGDFEVETSVKLHTSRITVERVGEPAIPVNVAKVRSKDIPIRVIQTGKLENKLVKSTPVSETVSIKGSSAELEMLDAAEVTVDVSALGESGTIDLGYILVAKDGIDRDELTTLKIPENLVAVNNIIYEEKELPIKLAAKTETEYKLVEKDSKTDPETVWVGVDDNVDIKELTITIDENADEGDYKIDKQDGVYIPSDRRTIHVKPVWEKKN